LHYTNEPSTPKPIPEPKKFTTISKPKTPRIDWNSFFNDPVQTFKQNLPDTPPKQTFQERPQTAPPPNEITIAKPQRLLPDDW
jgi:hypothetical protein